MRLFPLFKKTDLIILVLALVAAVMVFGSVAQSQQKVQVLPIIKSPSTVGEVAFPHELHFDALEIECQTCHHEINAQKLNIPHKDYFDDFWIDCRICHGHDGGQISQAQSCSNCHHDSPTDIADETLSAKVVIHKNCWECHEVEVGAQASQSCQVCHIPSAAS
ncbi:cytochrome c3 family protein [Acidobacteriota bacterium]